MIGQLFFQLRKTFLFLYIYIINILVFFFFPEEYLKLLGWIAILQIYHLLPQGSHLCLFHCFLTIFFKYVWHSHWADCQHCQFCSLQALTNDINLWLSFNCCNLSLSYLPFLISSFYFLILICSLIMAWVLKQRFINRLQRLRESQEIKWKNEYICKFVLYGKKVQKFHQIFKVVHDATKGSEYLPFYTLLLHSSSYVISHFR